MNKKSFSFAAGALLLGLATLAAPCKIEAQPLNDRVEVNLPYSVTIGDKVLQPGHYRIEELDSVAGASPVLLIYGDNGMKFETSAMTIPALQNRTQPDTRVILHHIGNDYYFDKVWVQGKDYGYEFPLPKSVRERELEASSVSITTAQPAPAPASSATVTQTTTEQSAQTTATTAATQDMTASQSTADRAVVDTAPAPALTPAPDTSELPAAPASMPHTDAGWLMMLLSGGTLTGLGASLRRKR